MSDILFGGALYLVLICGSIVNIILSDIINAGITEVGLRPLDHRARRSHPPSGLCCLQVV